VWETMDDPNQQQISWNQPDEDNVYRGTTIDTNLASGHLNFEHQPFGGKGGAENALDIYGGNASSFPIQSMSMKGKGAQPVLSVVAAPTAKTEQFEQKGDDDAAPFFDGFQSVYAHHSRTRGPLEMVESVRTVLSALCESGSVDYEQTASFVFGGRFFGQYQDCEFQLSIFSDESSESVLELRRTAGESFQYNAIEGTILARLNEAGALSKDTDLEMNDDDESEQLVDPSSSFGFGLGFGALPPLDSMELDSNFTASDGDDVDEFKSTPTAMSKESAAQILEDAVNLNAMRDELRADIATLNEQMAKHEEIFGAVPSAVSKIVAAATSDQLFDCWAIKMYLGMLSKLISLKAHSPPKLAQSVKRVRDRWSRTVVNEVAPGVRFEFYPSQQIVRCCNQILGQLE